MPSTASFWVVSLFDATRTEGSGRDTSSLGVALFVSISGGPLFDLMLRCVVTFVVWRWDDELVR